MNQQYRQYLQSEDWQKKRTRKRKSNDSCAICHAEAGDATLDVHHLIYRNLVDVTMADLRVLCRRCHDVAHDLLREGRLVYRSAKPNSRYTMTKAAVIAELGRRGQALCPGVVAPTARGGWTKAKLASMGVPWPPPKGWLTRLRLAAKEAQ